MDKSLVGKKLIGALSLFFEAEEIRELEAPEELKKKLSRMHREAQAFLVAQDFGHLLEKLYLMAVFYRDRVGPQISSTAEGAPKTAVRIHFLLWCQLQHYLIQFSVFAEPKSYLRVLTLANAALFEVGQEWLRANGVSFEVKTLEQRDENDTVQEYPAIVFLENELSVPGQIASQLSKSGAHPHMLAYSPAYTSPGKWAGKLTERTLYVSLKFVMGLSLDPDTGHELFHWRHRLLEHGFRDDAFHGSVSRTAEIPFPTSAGSYQGGFGFDELPAHGYSVATRIERLRGAATGRAAGAEAAAVILDSQPGLGLANAMGTVLSDALSLLQQVRGKGEIEAINSTSNKTSSSDSRPSMTFSLGLGAGNHFGFRFADFYREGTEHILAVVTSNGWITTIPIFDKEFISQARLVSEARIQKVKRPWLGGYLSPFRPKQQDQEAIFFERLKTFLIERLTVQRDLAETFERDFSLVGTEGAAYLNSPSDLTRNQLLTAMEKFSKYNISH